MRDTPSISGMHNRAVAHPNQIAVVFSEDFTPGMVVEGVRFVDPFSERFDLREWVV